MMFPTSQPSMMVKMQSFVSVPVAGTYETSLTVASPPVESYCMMHITVPFSAGRSFVGFGIRYYVLKLCLPIGENTKEFVRNVPGV